jgi:hypothetical protein
MSHKGMIMDALDMDEGTNKYMRIKIDGDFRDLVKKVWRYDPEATSGQHFAVLAMQDRVEKVLAERRAKLVAKRQREESEMAAMLNGGGR